MGSVRLQSLLLLAAFALSDVRYRIYLHTFIYCYRFYISTIYKFPIVKKICCLPRSYDLLGVAMAEVFPNASKHGVT